MRIPLGDEGEGERQEGMKNEYVWYAWLFSSIFNITKKPRIAPSTNEKADERHNIKRGMGWVCRRQNRERREPRGRTMIVWWGEHAIELFGEVVGERAGEWLRWHEICFFAAEIKNSKIILTVSTCQHQKGSSAPVGVTWFGWKGVISSRRECVCFSEACFFFYCSIHGYIVKKYTLFRSFFFLSSEPLATQRGIHRLAQS